MTGASMNVTNVSVVHGMLNDLAEDRDKWRNIAIKSMVGNLILGSGIIAAIVFMAIKGPVYFATSPTGQLTPLIPLNRPSTSSLAVQRFAVTTITESLSLNFAHWRNQLAVVEPRYTREGYKSYLDQIEQKGWIKKLEANWLTSTATEVSRPVLVSEGLAPNGIYGYVVEVPITLTLQNSAERQRQDMKARIVVVRVPTSDFVDGIAVDRVNIL